MVYAITRLAKRTLTLIKKLDKANKKSQKIYLIQLDLYLDFETVPNKH